MGRGDKKTAKGKRFKGSFGNCRPSRVKIDISAIVPKEKKVAKVKKVAVAEEVVKVTAKKAPPKKKAAEPTA